MAKRYELSDAQWARIAGLLPGKKGDRGRTAKDNRIFVDGVLWVLRSGGRWSDLPERYGKWKSVHQRFVRHKLKTQILAITSPEPAGAGQQPGQRNRNAVGVHPPRGALAWVLGRSTRKYLRMNLPSHPWSGAPHRRHTIWRSGGGSPSARTSLYSAWQFGQLKRDVSDISKPIASRRGKPIWLGLSR